MALVAQDALIGPGRYSKLRRPTWFPSMLLDAGLAAGAYVAAYQLRFPGERIDTFLPTVWSTLPVIVVGQLVALVAMRAYARWPRVDWLMRVVFGIVGGTAASWALLGLTVGFAGVSRNAYVADAVLFSIGAVVWRGIWVLRARARARAATQRVNDDLVDRAEELTTLGAVVTSLYNYRELLKTLVIKDLKLKYRGSVFGFLWSLVNPLMMIVVYTVAFTYILHVRSEGFVFYVMLGVLSWTFFVNSATMSTGAITDNAGLLKSVFFPRAILPIATVLFNLAQYLLTVAVFFPVMIMWNRIPLSATMALFPAFLALHALFTVGVALMLATGTLFFRDIRHLLEVALAALFWTTPILYELRQVPERLQLLVLLSPMSPFIVAYQKIFYFREWPEPTLWLVAVAYALGSFTVGSMLILALEPRFTEQL